MNMSSRDTSFSVLKALAIISVVISHSGAPGWLSAFVFQFHVPVFFICAGYFFDTKYLGDGQTYVLHRFKGLYVPFLKWSLLFLCLHNVFFWLGLLNEQCGNVDGGVLHPYDWHTFVQRAWSCVFNMSGYDEFICGAFWFFRAYLLASVGFLVLFKLFSLNARFSRPVQAGWGVALCAFLLAVWLIGGDLRATGVAQGGYRELMGMTLMGIGFLYRQYKDRVPLNWLTALLALGYLVAGSVWFPVNMGYRPALADVFLLPFSATAGFFVLLYVSKKIALTGNVLHRGLSYVGDRTLYVFAFHLLAFKLASAVKIACTGLSWQQMGCHPAIHAGAKTDYFWLLYVLVGVAVPLLWNAGYQRADSRWGLSRMGLTEMARIVLVSLFTLLRKVCLLVLAFCRGFVVAVKGIISASNPKDE